MKTAIAILNWNGEKLLAEFLPSVVENSSDAEIYIIDNHSTDHSIAFVEANFPTVKIIHNSENFGFAKGYNEGLKSIDADILCLLNSDVKVTPNWLSPILEIFKNSPEVAAIQPKILNYKKPNYFEYAGAAGGFIDNLGYPYCRGRIFWTLEEDKGQYNDVIETFWASGASLFIRKKDFDEINGFDENFFAHMEEIDLCWRLQKNNRKVFYCGHSTVYHLGGGTLQSSNPRKTYLNFRNSLLMLYKNLSAWTTFPLIFTRLSLDGITGLVFFRYHGFKHCWAIVESHFAFYARLGKYRKLRKAGKKNYFQHKWIPFQYFLLKRKKFNELK